MQQEDDEYLHVYELCISDPTCISEKELNTFQHLHSLYLPHSLLHTATSALSHLHTLNLSHSSQLRHVSALQHLHTLDLSYCTALCDVSSLGKIHVLNLSGCTAITDLSSLHDVYHLNLSHCSQLVEIDALGGQYHLNLSHCVNIHCVAHLAEVVELNLSHCYAVSDVSALGHVYTLNLSHCSKITNVSCLRAVTSLNLSGCDGITSVSSLGHLHTLNISSCQSLRSIQGLENVHDLDLTGCERISEKMYYHLCKMHTLKCTINREALDLSLFQKVYDLTLHIDAPHEACIPRLFTSTFRKKKWADGIRHLNHVYKLSLVDTDGVNVLTVDGLEFVHELVLENWHQLDRTKTVLRLESLVARDCGPRVVLNDIVGNSLRALEVTGPYTVISQWNLLFQLERLKIDGCYVPLNSSGGTSLANLEQVTYAKSLQI